MTDHVLTIDPEFEALCPAHTAEEFDLLEMSIIEEGVRDAIVVWANHDDTILDGHTRYRICQQAGIPFKTKALALATREEAINWIIATQLARRNVSEQQKAYLRGKRYRAEEKGHGGSREASGQNAHLKTAERLAEEYDVDEKTIRRDADFADAVDKVAETHGKEAKAVLLSGAVKKSDVIAVAELPKTRLRQALEAMSEGDKAKLKKLLGKTPQQESKDDPERRWHALLHKLYVFTTSTRDEGGIKRLVREWTDGGRAEYADELKRIVGELTKWIEILEAK